MDGLMQDLIVMLSFGIFGIIVIIKHFEVLNEIKYLKKELIKVREISDFSKMQDDLIQFRQDLINIDAKYKLKDRWAVDKIGSILDVLLPSLALSVKNLEDSIKSQKSEDKSDE